MKVFQFFLHIYLKSTKRNVILSTWLVSMEICIKGIFISIWNLPIKVRKENIRTKSEISEAYSELSQTYKMELFANILDGFQLQPNQTSELKLVNNFPQKLHLRCSIGFWICIRLKSYKVFLYTCIYYYFEQVNAGWKVIKIVLNLYYVSIISDHFLVPSVTINHILQYNGN